MDRWCIFLNIIGTACLVGVQVRDKNQDDFDKLSLTCLETSKVTPLQDNVLYRYVEDLRASGTLATRSSSFLAALRFAEGTLGLPCDVDVLFTAPVLEAVHRSLSTKGSPSRP